MYKRYGINSLAIPNVEVRECKMLIYERSAARAFLDARRNLYYS